MTFGQLYNDPRLFADTYRIEVLLRGGAVGIIEVRKRATDYTFAVHSYRSIARSFHMPFAKGRAHSLQRAVDLAKANARAYDGW